MIWKCLLILSRLNHCYICIATSRILRVYESFPGILLEFPWKFHALTRWFHFLFRKCHFLVGNLIFISILNYDPPRGSTTGSTRIHHVDPPRYNLDHPRTTKWIHKEQPHGSTMIHHLNLPGSIPWIYPDPSGSTTEIHKDAPCVSTRIHNWDPWRLTQYWIQDKATSKQCRRLRFKIN